MPIDLLGNETAQQILTVAAVGLCGIVAILYREVRIWQRRWADEVRERSRDAELFLKALGKRRSGSSDPPSQETPTNQPASTRSRLS
jgi:hypothetical protein